MRWLEDLIKLVEQDKIASLILLLILGFIAVIIYKNNKTVQNIYNYITNYIPFIKKEYIMIANFSKKSGNVSDIVNKYSDAGCKVYKLNNFERFSKDGSISKNDLEKVIQKEQKTIKYAKRRMKNKKSFIYVGFPHVPLGFLDGVNFTDIDDPILYEYQGKDNECLGKGFFELKTIYNSNIDLVNNLDSYSDFKDEIAVKIEQSFGINDSDINKVIKVSQIIVFGLLMPVHSGIANYAQIDIYQRDFDKLLSVLKDKGVNRIHLFATTPISLSFSLGRIIKHYHPEIIVYNFNNGRFDWGINLRTQDVVSF